ncbi:MAG: hypothetical protein ACRCT2_10885, partial [Plesiomonas shigelloides]
PAGHSPATGHQSFRGINPPCISRRHQSAHKILLTLTVIENMAVSDISLRFFLSLNTAFLFFFLSSTVDLSFI